MLCIGDEAPVETGSWYQIAVPSPTTRLAQIRGVQMGDLGPFDAGGICSLRSG
jgi:hypothetical protein